MAGLTGTKVAERVKRQFGDESGVQVTDADILNWINDAVREVYFQNDDQRFAEVTITPSFAGQNAFFISSAFYPNQELKVENLFVLMDPVAGVREKLTYYPPAQFDALFPQITHASLSLNETGTPSAYTKANGGIKIYPAVESTSNVLIASVTVSTTLDITSLVAEITAVPDHLHNYIVEFCLMKAYEMDEDWEAARMKAEYVQSSLDFNQGRITWVNRESYPMMTVRPEDM